MKYFKYRIKIFLLELLKDPIDSNVAKVFVGVCAKVIIRKQLRAVAIIPTKDDRSLDREREKQTCCIYIFRRKEDLVIDWTWRG